MSTTRRAPKRKRDRRRAETEQLRTARRDSLSILLSRAQRGVLTRDEAALLRAHVETELADGDTARASERGQQRAMETHRQRVEAAELAIVEAEQRAEQAEQVAARQREMHEARRRALADALAADEGTQWPQLVALARRIRHDAWANGRDCREEHERARRAEQALDRVRQADSLGAALAAVAEHDGLTPQAAAVQAALTDRADRPEARLAEQAREHAVALATERRTGERALEAWKERTREAEEQAAQQRARANGWRAHAIEADDRGDRYRNAWRSARRRAAAAEQALAAELPIVQAAEQALADAPIPYQLAEQAAPAVVTDRAAIRNALDEPELADQ